MSLTIDTWYDILRRWHPPRRRGAPKPRYRWVASVGAWCNSFDLEVAKTRPGTAVRFLPPIRTTSLFNGGW